MAIEYRSKNKARLTVYVGLDASGKEITARKTITYIDKRDAKRQYEAFVMEVRSGIVNTGADMTVIQLCQQCIDSMRRKGRKETTITGYESVLKRIKKTLGNPKAKNITPLHVDRYVDELAEQFSPKTVRNTIFFLSSCYNQAIKWRLLSSNPFEMVELPAAEHKEKRVLQDGELVPFIETLRECDNKDFVVAVEIALFCGLRRSEILGLTEEDIDLDEGTVTVNKSRHHIDGQAVIQTTKTKGSERIVYMPEMLTSDIRDLIRSHKEKSLAIREYQRNDFLIRNSLGLPYAPARLTEHLAKFETANNLPPVSLHGLRHTHATLANYLGHDMMEISRQMGHSQLSTTMNIYTHMFRGAAASSKSIARDINEIFVAN